MSQTAQVSFRIDKEVKQMAEQALNDMGYGLDDVGGHYCIFEKDWQRTPYSL